MGYARTVPRTTPWAYEGVVLAHEPGRARSNARDERRGLNTATRFAADAPVCGHKGGPTAYARRTRTKASALGPAGSTYAVAFRTGAACGAPATVTVRGTHLCTAHAGCAR